MLPLSFKRGASFVFTGPVLINGAVQNMTGWQISAALREWVNNGTVQGDIGLAIATLPCNWVTPAEGIAQIGDVSVVTSSWPVGPAAIDIQLITPTGLVIMTDTQKINILDRVTRTP